METEIYQNQSKRKVFFLVTLLTLLVLLLLRLFIFKNDSEDSNKIAISVIENLFVSLLTSVAVSYFIFYIIQSDRKNEVSIIQYQNRSSALLKLRENSLVYYYYGNIGAYTRSITFKYFSEKAFQKQESIYLRLNILDFRDEKSCINYSKIKTAFNKGNKQISSEDIKNDVCATILIAYFTTQENPYLKVEVSLRNNPSFVRYDVSDSNLLITKENPLETAMLANNQTFIYKSIREQIIHFNEAEFVFPLKNIAKKYTINDLGNLLEALSIRNHFTESDIEAIKKKVELKENPYASFS